MPLTYIPLLRLQRDLHDLPRGRERFERYRTLLDPAAGEAGGKFYPPLLIVNPMAREQVAARLDEWLALDADSEGARTAKEMAGPVGEESKVALVVADDAGGGWTNRYAWEFSRRFERPPAVQRGWVAAVLWASEAPALAAAREAVRTAILREEYVRRHGLARTLRERLSQEGVVMARAGCTGPELDPAEISYTREVMRPHLDATDLPTTTTLLFGDPAARSLGYEPSGLSPWAGLALALHDARAETNAPLEIGR